MSIWSRLAILAVLLALAAPAGRATAAPTATLAWCANSQPAAAARSSVGVPIRIRGRVIRTYYASSSRGRPTFIDLLHPYPDRRRVTLVIWGEDRVNFPTPPERMFKRGQLICAQGIPHRYAGAVNIEVGLWDAVSRLLTF